jgi:hypothetical protein
MLGTMKKILICLKIASLWLKIIILTIYYNTIGQIKSYFDYIHNSEDIEMNFKFSPVYVYDLYEDDLYELYDSLRL